MFSFPQEEVDFIIDTFGSITVNYITYDKLKRNGYKELDTMQRSGGYKIWISKTVPNDMCRVPKDNDYDDCYSDMTFEKAFKLAKLINFA